MKKWILTIFIIAGVSAIVYGISGKPHEFAENECAMCHISVKDDPKSISSGVTYSCSNCHKNLKDIQSHPTDIYPTMHIPDDMPLMNSKITCLTCHYAHPKKKKQFVEKHYFLRRMVRGPLFCNICHDLSEKGHVVLAKLHGGSLEVTDPGIRLDKITLECIECHDTYITDRSTSGAGMWDHGNGKLPHPVGISQREISTRKPNMYRNASLLDDRIKLFGEKIGCGTCHNVYSKIPNMLVMSNDRSRLCLQCHLK